MYPFMPQELLKFLDSQKYTLFSVNQTCKPEKANFKYPEEYALPAGCKGHSLKKHSQEACRA